VKARQSGLIALVFFTILCARTLPAQSPASVAFLSVSNLTGDPRYDYLAGITQGLLLFDLSRAGSVTLLDRNALEDILREQELQLSGIADDEAVQVGRLLGADWLLKGEYVFLGQDALFNLTLIEVETGRAVVFSDRGSTENTLHGLAERLIQRVSGERLSLRSASDRSIISLKDETPGAIALHSPLIDAEILLDGEFVGYSTGNVRVPFVLEDLRPGPHVVSLRLRDFGVVDLPQVAFRDWQETVVVESGKRHVVRAQARHFNDLIYGLTHLLREDLRLRSDDLDSPLNLDHDVSFTDREGRLVQVVLELELSPTEDGVALEVQLLYDGEQHHFVLGSTPGLEEKRKEEVGKVELELSIDNRYGDRFEVDYAIWRTDIWQNMWRDGTQGR
jgi:TolB-like protein